jgi:hypothetical protein
MDDFLTALTAQMQQLSIQAAAPSASIPLPSKFSGDRNATRGFLSQLESCFELQPDRFRSDRAKILTLGILLDGYAREWYAPFSEYPDQFSEILRSWNTFRAHFLRTFSEADPVAKADAEIRKLAQGSKPILEYSIEFRRHAASLNWGQQALMSEFLRGLNRNMKNLLVHHDRPTTLLDLIELSAELDLTSLLFHAQFVLDSKNMF